MNIEARNADLGLSARRLAAASEPVFIFDGRLPVLVWANDAALAFVGYTANAADADRTPSGPSSPLQLPHLDRAMPAMMNLRTIAEKEIPASGKKMDLIFWTAQGARRLSCHCRRASFAFAQEALIVHGLPLEPTAAIGTAGTSENTKPALAAARPAGSAALRSKVPLSRQVTRAPANRRAGKTSTGRPRADKTGPNEIDSIKNGADEARSANARTVARAPAEAGSPAMSATSATHMPAQALRPAAMPAAHLADDRPLASGDAVALREIARQIQSATFNTAPSISIATMAAAHTCATPEPKGQSAAPPATAELTPVLQSPDFLSQIGHEIRTPLNSILGFAEIMREERLGPVGNARYKSYAADIHESASHALSLINDLLDLSRLEAGGLHLEPVEVNVAEMIAKTVGTMQPVAEKAGVVLIAPASRPLPKLVCDERSLKQMLLNLLSNAIKQTDNGGAVWATAAVSDKAGLIIRVQDTGVGMSAEDVALALEPYRQVGAAERRAGGTGLGLPLTKAMAEANGGRLQLERIAGGGLAVLLIFPAESVVRT